MPQTGNRTSRRALERDGTVEAVTGTGSSRLKDSTWLRAKRVYTWSGTRARTPADKESASATCMRMACAGATTWPPLRRCSGRVSGRVGCPVEGPELVREYLCANAGRSVLRQRDGSARKGLTGASTKVLRFSLHYRTPTKVLRASAARRSRAMPRDRKVPDSVPSTGESTRKFLTRVKSNRSLRASRGTLSCRPRSEINRCWEGTVQERRDVNRNDDASVMKYSSTLKFTRIRDDANSQIRNKREKAVHFRCARAAQQTNMRAVPTFTRFLILILCKRHRIATHAQKVILTRRRPLSTASLLLKRDRVPEPSISKLPPMLAEISIHQD
ncbi:hypothetical protein EVAR_22292_1 [Eumeta japonica]|uniref:Uncharacterized protein n=1 Tax=Eumeta variegata TaxID=151549 RepID=A0A4C1UAH3_EUMVA|nr:hypothetical protein EVAR_22292_1 [Eumeta japonica]